MNYLQAIQAYMPQNQQEAADKASILELHSMVGERLLTRDCVQAHLTSSAFIVNPARDKALMCRHIILNRWAWTGGHADGEADLLAVALREAEEETGAQGFRLLSPDIASIDILGVPGHVKRGKFVSNHLHLSVAYLVECPDDVPLQIRPGENTDVAWLPVAAFNRANFDEEDTLLYNKLLARARAL